MKFYKAADAAKLLGYSRVYYTHLCCQGIIPAKKIRGQWYLLEDDLKKIINPETSTPSRTYDDLELKMLTELCEALIRYLKDRGVENDRQEDTSAEPSAESQFDI